VTYDLSRAHPNNPFRQPEFIPASEWVEAGYPVNGARWLGFGPKKSKVDTQIAHYQGAKYPLWKLSPADVDVVRRLREGNRASWIGRGYALYYSFDVPVDGRLWGIRAFDFRNAANADNDKSDGNENDWSYSLHTILQKLFADNSDTTVDPTWDQLETHRWLRWEAREYAIEEGNALGFEVDMLGHRDLEPTGCPGNKMYAAIQAGVLAIPPRVTNPVPPPNPRPPAGGRRTMKIFQPDDCLAQFMGLADEFGNTPVITWIQTAEQQQSRDEYIANGAVVDRGPRNPAVGRSGFKNCTLLGPVPHGDPQRNWTEADFYRVVG
jgi:hypothetical protein